MAKSPLTLKQWKEIENRYLPPGNEKGRVLAEEFGISETAIRKKFGSQKNQINTVANQLVSAEISLKQLDFSSQVRAENQKDKLLSISKHMLSVASISAASTHRLSMLANEQLERLGSVDTKDPDEIESNSNALRSFAGFTELANEASKIPLNILNANKDKVKDDGLRVIEHQDRPKIACPT